MRIETEAIVINSKKVAESDVIITLLTKNKGKLRVYANGARHSRSKFASATQLFVSGVYDIFLKHELHKLISADINAYHRHLREDLDKFFVASYIVESMQKAFPTEAEDGESYIFLYHVLKTLNELCDNSKLPLLKLTFDVKFIRLLGYQISIFNCVNCGTNSNLLPVLSIDEGGVLCKACINLHNEQNIKIGLEGIKLLNLLLNNSFEYIQTLIINDIILRDIDLYLRQFIHKHILDGELKSLRSLDDFIIK